MSTRTKDGSPELTQSSASRSLRERSRADMEDWSDNDVGNRTVASISESPRGLMSTLAQTAGVLEYEVSLGISVLEALVRELSVAEASTRAVLDCLEESSQDGLARQGLNVELVRSEWTKINERLAEVTSQMQRVVQESDDLGRLSGGLGVVTADTPYIAEALECGVVLEDLFAQSEVISLQGSHGRLDDGASECSAAEHDGIGSLLDATMDSFASAIEENLPMVVACALVDKHGKVVRSRLVRDQTARAIDELFEVEQHSAFVGRANRRQTTSGRSYELRRRSPVILENSWLPLQELVVPLRRKRGRRDGGIASGLEHDLLGYEFHLVYIVDRRRSNRPGDVSASEGVDRRMPSFS